MRHVYCQSKLYNPYVLGNNSPAARPEFVDISLNATGSAGLAEDGLPEDGEEGEE
jgi:hypothetical protein